MNKDLQLAVQMRDEQSLTISIVRDCQAIYQSQSKGILPLYQLCVDQADVRGASVADRVIGKGAAVLLVHMEIAALHTLVISDAALRYLQKNGIMVSYDKKVDYIINRTGDGMCPVETMAMEMEDIHQLLNNIAQFLKRVGLIETIEDSSH